MIVEKMRSHITTINRLYAQLERIIHGNHSEDAQKCFREVTKAADCAINLCYFFENWKEKGITDNKYVTDYYKKYKSALWARAMFLNIQESKLNMILYKNMSLDEIRKELNRELTDNRRQTAAQHDHSGQLLGGCCCTYTYARWSFSFSAS